VILVTAGGSAAVLVLLGGDDAGTDRASEALDSGYSAFATVLRERYERLGQLARLMAAEPPVRALAATPEPPGEVLEAALVDLERFRFDLGFLLVLDAGGRVLARAEDPAGAPEQAAPILPTETGEGIRVRDGRLFQTTTAAIPADPQLPGVPPLGFIVAGQAVDSGLLSRLQRIGKCDLVLLVPGAGGVRSVGGTLDRRAEEIVGRLAASPAAGGASVAERVLDGGEVVDRAELEVADRPYLALVAPLFDARGTPTGAVALVAERRRSGAGLLRQLAGIGAVAAVALLLSVPLSTLLGGSVTGPLRRLTAAVRGARHGDLDQRSTLGVRRSGAVGTLAAEVEGLLGDFLQEKSLREAVEAAMGSGGSAPGTAAGNSADAPAPAVRQAALLLLELRRFARAREPEAVGRLARALERIDEALLHRGGRIEAVSGHRVLASFEGERQTVRALVAAGEILDSLRAPEGLEASDDGEPPAAVLTVGRSVTGTVPARPGGGPAAGGWPATLGLPVQLLETLLREAAPGDVLLSREAARDLGEAGVNAAAQPGMLTPQPIYSVSLEAALQAAERYEFSTGPLLSPRTAAFSPAPAAGGSRVGGLSPGHVLGDRFEIRAAAGDGPLGTVYRALDRELGREVALKALRRDALSSTEELEKLDSELAPLRTFLDSHVARVYDFGVLDGVPFLSRQWVDGVSMRELLARVGPLRAAAALAAARQLAAGVAAAHEEGLSHLRLKPENVLFQGDGGLRVTDFGLAPLASPRPEGEETGSGYLAPEQEQGGRGDERSDVFACGLLVHRLFTAGAAAGTGEPGRGALPEPVEELVRRCLAPEPAHRFGHAGELREALEELGLV
jgi:serine/threonine-protein kinase